MWEQLTSPASRWVYGIVLSVIVIPISKWVSNNRKEKRELVDKVSSLEVQINNVDSKIDTEITERREMEAKFDKFTDNINTKFDGLTATLNQVAINTAVNAAKIDK